MEDPNLIDTKELKAKLDGAGKEKAGKGSD